MQSKERSEPSGRTKDNLNRGYLKRCGVSVKGLHVTRCSNVTFKYSRLKFVKWWHTKSGNFLMQIRVISQTTDKSPS